MKDYIEKHYSDILKIFDYFAMVAFIFATIVSFSVGNISAGAANCSALLWVLIARQRQESNDMYSKICNDMFKIHDAIKDECIDLKNKLAAIVKDNANDNFNSEK